MESLGVGDAEKNFGVGGSGLGIESAEPTGAKISRGDGVAIGPAKIGAKMKGVGFSVGRNIPGGGGAGNGVAAGVATSETFVESAAEAAFELAGDEGGIEGLGFGSVAEDEIGPGAILARGEAERGEEKAGEAGESPAKGH